jgi:hypothetical protein
MYRGSKDRFHISRRSSKGSLRKPWAVVAGMLVAGRSDDCIVGFLLLLFEESWPEGTSTSV